MGDIRASQSGDTQNFTADSLSVDALSCGDASVASASGRRLTPPAMPTVYVPVSAPSRPTRCASEPPRLSIRPRPTA